MYRRGLWALGGVLILGLALAATGCAKKQTVRSNENEGMQAAVQKPAPAMHAQNPVKEEGIKEARISPPKESATAGSELTKETKSVLADIHFDFDKSIIRATDRPELQKIAEEMKRHPNTRLRIEGNCDERGTAEYNMALGDRRAQSAKEYLVALGIPADHIATISFGKEKPLDPGHNEAAWAKNRRDHFYEH